ncbi:MAG: hypothetical protein ACI80P_001862, partial [Flavobacteriales bacterium]
FKKRERSSKMALLYAPPEIGYSVLMIISII